MELNEEQKLLLDTYDVILGLDEIQCLTLFNVLDTVEKWHVLEEDSFQAVMQGIQDLGEAQLSRLHVSCNGCNRMTASMK